MKFKIKKRFGKLGRVGEITTPHGKINTPAFVTVGTKATIKALTPEMLESVGAEVALSNTYHLYLQPGHEIVEKAGGLNKFMNWEKPSMTDSGGFQVFSLGVAYGKNISKFTSGDEIASAEILLEEITETSRRHRGQIARNFEPAKIDENGVMFRSHIDGSAHYFTPEKSIEIQHKIGADIIFAFDECTSPHESLNYQRESLDRTHRWAKQSLKYHLENTKKTEYNKQNKDRQALFGIVQGGRHEELRRKSAKALREIQIDGQGFDGFGIGGSFQKEDMEEAVRWVNEELPREKPRHLLGIGEPEDLFMAVENGCDLFDCVAPTRIARTGQIYTINGKINLKRAEFAEKFKPLSNDIYSFDKLRPKKCQCYSCKNYTVAYLHHLFKADEMLAATLASIHNLYFIINLVKRMRKEILKGDYQKFKKDFLRAYKK